MWKRTRRERSSALEAAVLTDDRQGRLVAQAFRELAGTTNGVIYDLPRALKPQPTHGSIFLHASPAWRSYLDARQQVDTGQPAILFALRALDDEERNLAVDWGATYPNTFFLVEPHERECDLTDPTNRFSRRLNDALAATLRIAAPGPNMPEGWTRTTPLGERLRDLFGTWVYWSGPPPDGETQQVPLEVSGDDDSLWTRVLSELTERFPQQAFDRALAYVNDLERELLGGPVPRARSVFRTRLGMPILRDTRCVDRALRKLVNEGRITVVAPSLPGRPIFGRGRPVPDEISDEEFTGFVMR